MIVNYCKSTSATCTTILPLRHNVGSFLCNILTSVYLIYFYVCVLTSLANIRIHSLIDSLPRVSPIPTIFSYHNFLIQHVYGNTTKFITLRRLPPYFTIHITMSLSTFPLPIFDHYVGGLPKPVIVSNQLAKLLFW